MSGNEVVIRNDEPEKKTKTAFIVTPIGGDNTGIRRATDGLIKSVLSPALKEHGFECKASHEEDDLGSISIKIIKHLIEDDLVVVNLSTLNANVMYELGIRHATGKPVILISNKETELPFDTKDQRTIFYSNDMMGGLELREKLDKVLSDPRKLESNEGNPIYMATSDSVLNKAIQEKVNSANVSPEEKDLVNMVLSKMEKFENKMSAMITHNKEYEVESYYSRLMEYVNSSVDGYGIVRRSGNYLIGIKDQFWADAVKRNISQANYKISDAVRESGGFIICVANNDIGTGEELKKIVLNSELPF
ncbi:hypothetical protein LG409_02560 [Halomonas sp. NyZ770]|uniref:hypothetical protein n=1 Tax=Halomonas sp. NyZ770 TaxID=2883106 RepID=UPI001D0B5F36|nr:hypothetical protein [Halomonas sp. NyZ770]UDM07803.1 hypothetical protein LG409_02560 [Halomonas sp. NyZ770]